MGKFKIKGLRWYIAGMLCLVTTINYIDRTSLQVVGPVLRDKLHIDANDFANIIIFFQLSYLIMQPLVGRIMDWLGTKRGFSLAVIWWSVANILHAFVRTPLGFGSMRALLGMGEAGNFPGVAKTASEWFPPKERTMATGIANVGSGTGSLIAMPLVAWIIMKWGWQEAFVVTGAIGFVWVLLWQLFYHPPEQHPNITQEELDYIKAGQRELDVEDDAGTDVFCPRCGHNLRGLPRLVCPECGVDSEHRRASLVSGSGSAKGVWGFVLKQQNFWGIALPRFLAEPAWQFFSYWIVFYMMDQKGIDLKQVAYFAWVPFLAADAGSFLGGMLSPFYQKKLGLTVLTSRKLAMLSGALMLPFLLMVLSAPTPGWAIFWFCFGPFGHNIISSVMLTLPADLFPKRTVATANGLSGCIGYIGGMTFTKIVGLVVAATHNYVPIFIAMAFMDIIGAAILFALVREPRTKAA